jgi:fumarate hydratase subunit beta
MATYKIETPISEEDVRRLRVHDVIYVTGTMITARDAAHRRALDFHKEGKELPINLQGLAVFHCGPIVKKETDKWVVVSAGPTTSMRMEVLEGDFIKNFGVRLVIGKGGMGKRTTEVMKQYGAVYGVFTGGAAVLAAKFIRNVKSVEWYDLGIPEAMWIFEVEDFGPLIVTIDAQGNNLFEDLNKKVEEKRLEIYEKLGF